MRRERLLATLFAFGFAASPVACRSQFLPRLPWFWTPIGVFLCTKVADTGISEER